MPARNQIADLLKGIAVVLMVQVHIIELFASSEIYVSPLGKVSLLLGSAPVAPVFMVILGYFIVCSSKSNSQVILKGLKVFGLGILLNVALNLNLIISVINGLYQVELLPYILGVDILQFAGISMIVIALSKKAFEKSLTLLILCVIISAFLGHFLLNYIPENPILIYCYALFYGSCPWSYFPLFPWLAYPLTGMVFFQIQQTWNFNFLDRAKIKLFILVSFLCYILFTIKYAISISSELPLYYHHGIVFFSWTILFLIFYSFFLNEVNKLLENTLILKCLRWLGKHVTLIYIIQWIIIGNIATEIYKTILSPFYLLVCFTGIIGVSSVIAYSILKLKKQRA